METQNIENEIVLYEVKGLEPIEVRVANDTVWLTQAQMAQLFDSSPQNITIHIKNVYEDGELEQNSTCKFFLQVRQESKRTIKRNQLFYNLDMIISVGYRVKSVCATKFRIWATSVLKQYLLAAPVNQQRMIRMEQKLIEHDFQLQSLLHAALPPKQGVFFEGQIFDAYQFVADLVRSAKSSIVLIDNYVNDSVLTLLDKRAANVTATIGVNKITPGLQLDLQRHNAQYPPIAVREIAAIHDRFLLIDGQRLYTFGASFKDLGKKLFCFSLLESEELVRAVGAMLQGGAGL